MLPIDVDVGEISLQLCHLFTILQKNFVSIFNCFFLISS